MLRSLFRRERPGLPDGWEAILQRRSAQWVRLQPDEQQRLAEIADQLAADKRWEAAQGFELTDEVRTIVAAHAALLVLGLDDSWYDEVRTIVVRRGAMRKDAPVPHWGRVEGIVDGSPGAVDGEAHDGRGPIMINWASARREASNLRLGRDVVLHEFAHKLDMRDSTIDGTPHIVDHAARQRWIDVCTTEYEAVRAGGPHVLRSYAGTNPGEFFAVATETFFTRPVRLEDAHRDLYDVLRAFYGQDPAQRERRYAAALADPR